jgi:predicted MFS family arabinose efflux permease
MPTVRNRRDLASASEAELQRLREPRDDLLLEREVGPAHFIQARGPFVEYERRLAEDATGVTESISYRFHIPWFGWIFALPVRHSLRRPSGRTPWWAPPDRLDAERVRILGLLCAAGLVFGYCSVVFSQTIAFAADEFGASEGDQALAGTVVRWGVLLTLALTALTDRLGRRRVLVGTAILCPLLTAAAALAPSLAALTAAQTVARPVALALGITISIVAAEEMPSGSRAYAVSLIALVYALGGGLCIMALPLADLGERGWRLVYAVPLVLLVIAFDVARHLPESKRFARPHAARPPLPRRRFVLVALGGLLFNLLVASSTFYENRYLKDERGYSATDITIYTLVTSTPGGIGVYLGGRLADTRGRRLVGAVGLVVGAIGTVLVYTLAGSSMWLSKLVLVSILGSMSIPVLGVYGPELFPTGARGRANGLRTGIAIVGSTISLGIAGTLLDGGVSYGSVMALLAVGPLVTAALLVTAYPETARVELEDLNPEDRRPSRS